MAILAHLLNALSTFTRTRRFRLTTQLNNASLIFAYVMLFLVGFVPPNQAVLSPPASKPAAVSAHFYHNIQNEFIERGCHNRLVGILIGRSGYVTSRNFANGHGAATGASNLISVVDDSSLITKGQAAKNITYPNNEYCQWMIKATPASRIRLRFTHFDIEPGKHCAYDNVSIWQVATSTAASSSTSNFISGELVGGSLVHSNTTKSPHRRLLGIFCGSDVPPVIESSVASSLLVVFRSDANNARSGFRLVWETFSVDDHVEQACSKETPLTLNDAQGIIQLNHFDGKTPYSPNMRCAWKIHIPAGKLVRLYFEHLDLESSKDCFFDSLEVYDGGSAEPANRLGKFCGDNNQPFSLTSSWNEMLIVFTSDNSTEKSGFQVKWHEVTLSGFIEMGCWQTRPAVIRGRSSGVLHLPGYNGAVAYEANMDCKWSISVANSSTIKLKLTKLSIEPESKSCMYDRLLLSHPSAGLEPIVFCGYEAPIEIIHWKSSELLVEFSSDESVQAIGFRLEWQEVPLNEISEQPSTASFNRNVIGNNNSEGNVFHNGDTPLAVYDRELRVTTAISNISALPPKTSNNMAATEKHSDVTTTTPFLFKNKFTSGLSSLEGTQNEGLSIGSVDRGLLQPQHSPPGFSTDVKKSSIFSCQTPRRYYYSRAGKLSSPGYGLSDYPADAHCSYVITVPEGYSVHLNFTAFEVEYSHNCDRDYVAIYEGDTEHNKTIAKLCGFLSPGKSLDSIGNRILVVFHSNNHTGFKGFSATFAAIRQPNYAEVGCWWGEENPAEISADSGVLTSRSFDGVKPYLYNQRCAWHLSTNATSRISIHFSHFSLESTEKGCAGDTLAIYDGADKFAPVLGVFCGIAIPPPVSSSGRNLFITFRTDERVQRTGFRLEWHSVPVLMLSQPSTAPSPMPFFQTMETAALDEANSSSNSNSSHNPSPDAKLSASSIVQASWPGAGIGSVGGLPRGFMPAPSPSSALSYSNQQQMQPPYNHHQLQPAQQQSLVRPATGPSIPPGVRRILNVDTDNFVMPKSIHMSPNNGETARQQSINLSSSKEQSPSKRLPFYGRSAVSANNRASLPSFPPANTVSGKKQSEPSWHQQALLPETTTSSSSILTVTIADTTASNSRREFVRSQQTTSSTGAPTLAPTTPPNGDECLASYALQNSYSATASSYGPCDDGQVQVLTSSAEATQPSGIITSGNFDRTKMYPMLQDCVWSIRAQPGFRISVSFVYFDLERGRDDICPYDRVEFWDGASIPNEASKSNGDAASRGINGSYEIGEYCGFSPRKHPIVSSGSALTIRFVSDAVVQRSGFCLKWSAQPIESELLIAEEVGGRRADSHQFMGGGDISGGEPSGCGGPKYMLQGSGHIKSPNYGTSAYYPNLDCRWVVSAPPGKIVRVNLIDVDIEPDVSCRYDYLAVYDGASEYATVIKRLCGRPKPQIVRTTSNTVYLQFRSDATAEGKGFLIEYSFTDPPT